MAFVAMILSFLKNARIVAMNDTPYIYIYLPAVKRRLSITCVTGKENCTPAAHVMAYTHKMFGEMSPEATMRIQRCGITVEEALSVRYLRFL